MKKIYDLLAPILINTHDKKMIAVPLVLFTLAIVVIGGAYFFTGSPVSPGMDFVGGIQFTGMTHLSETEIHELLSDYPVGSIRSSGNRVIVQFSFMDESSYESVKEIIHRNFEDVEEKTIAPTYSKSLQQTTLKALLISFLGMALVIFILFRKLVSSLTVIVAAVSDIVITVAFMNIFGIELTLGTFAAILMLIGYSVDSNVLLTNKVFKHSGEINEKILDAFGTGLTMAITTLSALFVMFFVSTYLNYILPIVPTIPLLSQISSVLIVGLLADLVNTWLFNAGVLRWYMRSGRRHKSGSKKHAGGFL